MKLVPPRGSGWVDFAQDKLTHPLPRSRADLTIHDMRLDLFLKASRVCHRRTVGQQLCDAGMVTVNGVPAKSAHQVKPGDEISIKRRGTISTLKVLIVPSERQTAKKDAASLYQLLSEKKIDLFNS